MLRIGFDGRYINDRYHGIGRVAYSLLDAMLELDGDHRFVLFVHPGYSNSRFDLDRLVTHERVEVVPLRLPLLVPIEQAAWPLLVRRHRLDLVHSPYVVGPLAVSVPVVVTVHDLILERHPEYTPQRLLRLAYRAMARLSLRRASAIVAVSQATRADVERWYPATRGRTHVIPNGVSGLFSRVEDPGRLETVRARYGLPPSFVLAVGAGRPHKNLEVLVDAARHFGDDGPRVVLASAPDARFPDAVGDRIARLGLEDRVVRIRDVREDDMAALYSLADAFVFPSFIEGFGLPMLEAMAAGTPVIAADASVMPEVGGDAVLLFDPLDPAALAAQLRRLAGDPDLRDLLRERGIGRAAEFSWERAARATVELYRALT
ncbi:MAG TPA: glycosyltransferase family 1 protein [Cellulomonadaceae bacterium]|nr:glycosyltransferase family 1 protein [Cellulomonadaceae bacterium]